MNTKQMKMKANARVYSFQFSNAFLALDSCYGDFSRRRLVTASLRRLYSLILSAFPVQSLTLGTSSNIEMWLCLVNHFIIKAILLSQSVHFQNGKNGRLVVISFFVGWSVVSAFW